MPSKFKLLLCEILLRERKDKATEWEKIFVDHISDKDQNLEYMKNFQNSVVKNKNNPI